MKLKLFIFGLIVILLAGCSNSEPTVDASSDQTMEISIVRVWESLAVEKRAQFDEAIQVLVYNPIHLKSADEVAKLEGKRKDSVHGKTGEQIIAAAAQILERGGQQAERAYREIKKLEKKRQLALRSHDQLRKFKVLRSYFYKQKIEFKFLGEQPFIEVTVKNGTSQTVSQAHFKGIIASPDLDVTWFQGVFICSIPSGLRPGQEFSWRFAPSVNSGWGRVNAPPGAVFTSVVERLDGADGKVLYSNIVFGEKEEKHLAELKKKYNVN